jgi:hypothetical protein
MSRLLRKKRDKITKNTIRCSLFNSCSSSISVQKKCLFTNSLNTQRYLNFVKKHPFSLFLQRICKGMQKKKWLQRVICQRIVTILCVFAFLHSFFECFILPKDARQLFPFRILCRDKKTS